MIAPPPSIPLSGQILNRCICFLALQSEEQRLPKVLSTLPGDFEASQPWCAFICLTEASILLSLAPTNLMHFRHFLTFFVLMWFFPPRTHSFSRSAAPLDVCLPLCCLHYIYRSSALSCWWINKRQTLFIGSEVIKGILYSGPSPTNWDRLCAGARAQNLSSRQGSNYTAVNKHMKKKRRREKNIAGWFQRKSGRVQNSCL